jgi:hypothetical protein
MTTEPDEYEKENLHFHADSHDLFATNATLIQALKDQLASDKTYDPAKHGVFFDRLAGREMYCQKHVRMTWQEKPFEI